MPTAHAVESTKSKYVPFLAVGIILLILGTTVLALTVHLRKGMRGQVIQQDAIAIFAASLLNARTNEYDVDLVKDPELRWMVLSDRVLDLALGPVLDVRFFDERGTHQLSIQGSTQTNLAPAVLAQLKELKPVSTYEAKADLKKMGLAADVQAPVLRALVPLVLDDVFLGAAEFVIDGSNVADALKSLDRDLFGFAGVIFLAGGGIISMSLVWAFGRLQKVNDLLVQRTQSLLRANHELALSAKTSAIGAITAHLIHDLKSPLFGLQAFVSSRTSPGDEDWNIALDTTQRMQKLIGDVVRIMQEEKTSEQYEITVSELLRLLRSKVEEQAAEAGVELHFLGEQSNEATFTNRCGNIVLLIVTNIVQNALHATPRGGQIRVVVRDEAGDIFFQISDTGPGLPPHVQKHLFTPCRSGKTGGSGLGLAISKQLANHLGAELLLKHSSPEGTTFELRVPAQVLSNELAHS